MKISNIVIFSGITNREHYLFNLVSSGCCARFSVAVVMIVAVVVHAVHARRVVRVQRIRRSLICLLKIITLVLFQFHLVSFVGLRIIILFWFSYRLAETYYNVLFVIIPFGLVHLEKNIIYSFSHCCQFHLVYFLF